MERIVFLDRDTIKGALPRPLFPHDWVNYPSTSADQTADRVADATMVITNKVKITRGVLANAIALKFVAVSATGFDCVDIAACRERGIAVSNIPAYAGPSTAEHTLLLMLALRRNLPAYLKAVAEGVWQQSSQFTVQDFPVPGLEGAVLGLIGYGDIAQRVERLAQGFGMEVLIAERRGAPHVRHGRVAFEEVFRKADVVSLHCPSTPATEGMINAETLSWMKQDALLINAARGNLVDEAALAEAIAHHRIGGAGIDVLGEEPPRNGSPLLALRLPNLIVTPHMAWNSRRSVHRMTTQLIRNIEAFMAGHPINVV